MWWFLLACSPEPDPGPGTLLPSPTPSSETADTADTPPTDSGSSYGESGVPTGDTAPTGSTGDTAAPDDTAPTCLDPFDPNDTPGEARPFPGDWVRVSAADPDWWQLTLAPGSTAYVGSETFMVDWQLTDGDGVPLRAYPKGWLTVGNSSWDSKTYTLQALPPTDACFDYLPFFDLGTQPICADDHVADDWTAATPLVETYDGLLDGSDPVGTDDVDWYSFPLLAGATPRFEVWGDDEGIRADIYLDPTQPPLASWEGGYRYDYFELELSSPAPVDGTYYLRLQEVGGFAGCPRMQVYARR